MKSSRQSFIASVALAFMLWTCFGSAAQTPDTVRRLEEVSIGASRSDGVTRMAGAVNGQQIGQDELFRAACCNLGESFVANPSVDVNYNDAAVGARQIKLLGLSGQYVQMLLEGLPMAGGALMPYTLDFVPGAWMRSIAVSKGTSSVKQGYQSLTGQIDVEYMKPDEDQGVIANLYVDSRLKAEGNVVANVHLNKYLSTELLGHYERDFMHHDADGDLWHDFPALSQLHLQNRWKYRRGRYIMHAGVGLLDNQRIGGQMPDVAGRYAAEVDIRRYEAYMKHAYLLNREHNTNMALTANASTADLGSLFGNVEYGVQQQHLNSLLMLEHDFNDRHGLSTGLGFNAERLVESYLALQPTALVELTPGAYAQYTFKPTYRFTLMAGLRADRFVETSHQQWFVTPRLHLKWVPFEWLTLRATAGKGYRPAHPLAENHYLLASGRTLEVPHTILPEEAWNTGVSAVFYLPVGDRTVTLNAEYYYTHFLHQAVVDYDSDPLKISIYDLAGLSFSHTAQVDATYAFSDELETTAALRLNRVMCTYGNQLMEKPLQSRYKGLVTLSWKPMMGLWKVDATLQLNGGGRMPEPYTLADGSLSWEREFPAYLQLNMQLTREFRHLSVYVGGENLTGYRQPHPIINAANPWAPTFEPTMIWGPVHGVMVYAGVRLNFWRL